MIEIKNLCKTYEDHSGKVKALDNISFSLPNKGMVFVVGKSGCGKTTLLNILGGLDNLTSGDVYFNNKSLSSFSVNELDNYRNTTVGFVFQDFCLIERMSVKDNIKMALEFQNSSTKINYNKLLKDFGLSGLGRRKPAQLSAGQKQRVAIARAIVKNPDIILADEPTGNVDEKTSILIMDILKNISKEKLVVVISHNNDEAFKYGDRIIQMHDGKIVSDKSIFGSSSERLYIKPQEIVLPGHGHLSDADLEILNTVVKSNNGNTKISQNPEPFQEQNFEKEEKTLNLKKTKMSLRTKLKYAAFFFKKKIVFNSFIILLITFITSFFSIVEILGFVRSSFELDRMLKESGHEHLLLQPYKTGCYPVDEEKVNIEAEKYGVYVDYVYTVSFPIKPLSISSSTLYTDVYNSPKYYSYRVLEEGYSKELMGVQVTTNERFNELFKNYEILAGEIKQDGGGIIITDYVADSILAFRSNEYSSYQEIVDGGYIANRVDIDAIIKTDIYKKYPNLFNEWEKYKENPSLLLQLSTTYTFGYSLNKNFRNDFITGYKQHDSTYIHIPSYHFTSSKGKQIKGSSAGVSFDSSLANDELHLNYSTYNAYFGGNFNLKNLNTFKGDIFNIKFYDVKSNTIISKDFRVTKLYARTHYYDTLHISSKYFDSLYDNLTYSYAISMDTSEGKCYEMVKEHFHTYIGDEGHDSLKNKIDWSIPNHECHLMYATVELLSTFKGIFKFVSYLLMAAIFLIVILNSNTLIKHNVYEIGLMKAFGAKTRDLVMMFAAQMFFSSLIVCLFLYSASNLCIDLSNDLLKEGILAYAEEYPEDSYTFTTFVFLNGYFFLNIGLIAASTILSVVVPIIAIRKIKPLTIIRTRN